MYERLDERLEVARSLLSPIEQRPLRQIPGRPVGEANEVRQRLKLKHREHLGSLAVITHHLIECLADPSSVRSGLRLHKKDGNAIDQKNDIGTHRLDSVGEHPLVGHMEDVVLNLFSIDQSEVALPRLFLDENRLQ